MAEESKSRLVRCPKCENLIKELPEYSVYKCGSCGAVLRAKKKELASDGFSDKLMEKGRGGSEKVDNHLKGASETEFFRVEGKSRRKERILGEKSTNFNSVSSRIDKENVFLNDDKNGREHRLKHNRTEKGAGYVDNYMPSSKNPTNDWAQRHDHHDMNMKYRSKSVNSSRESRFGGYSPKLSNLAGSLRLKGVDRDGFGGFYKRSLETIDEQDRFSALCYPDEGPSSYRCASAYGYHKPVKSFEYLDAPNGVQNFEKDRAQLLKKLDELKDQLSRCHDVPQRPRELVPSDNKMASTGHLGGSIGKSSAHHRSAQYRQVSKLPYLNHHSMNDDEHVQNFYGNFHSVSKHACCRIPHGESLSPAGMHRRPHNQAHHRPQQRTYGYSSGQYVDFNEDLLATNPNQEETLYQLHACSCLYCYEKNWKCPSLVPPADFIDRRFLKDPHCSSFNHHVSSNRVGQHYLPRPAKCLQSNFEDPLVHLWPSDIDSDIDGFGGRRPRRVALTGRNKQRCHPIACGAPFITCYNCLELLKLPGKFRKMKNEQRLRCGACSTVVVFQMEKKRLIISVPGNTERRPTKAEEKPSELLNEGHPSSHGCFNAGGTIPTSNNVENFSYDQTFSKEDQSPDNVIDWRDSPGSAELPFSSDISPTVSSLPLQEQVKNPSSNQTVSGYRDRTKLEQQEKFILVKNTSQVVSKKNAPVAAEVEVSFNGHWNSSSSQDSLEASKEQNRLKLHKGSKSFLVGLIKKSFRDFARSNDNIKNERPNVLVNGQPISDSVVRKAEKQAGPIHPGNYWYDSRAGFWGVMGQPCSGIIPPFIEEFNYPMPENCAAGNTGVFINGRELHQKDLDLLACKGLPTARDKSYIIEVSGRVLDEGSGVQLYSLGKLAPTVEKEKRGFGMCVPGAVE